MLLTAPPLVILSYVFSPVIWLLNKASNLTLWVLGLGQTSTAELAHSEEELRLIVAESVAGGHLSRNERMMIENVLNLEEKTARRVMVPRPDIVYLSLARPLEDNLRIARQAGHTRFPLCEDDLTTVIGMIHVKDIFRTGAYQNGRTDLRQLARKIPFLPGDACGSTSSCSNSSATGFTWRCCSTNTAASSAWSTLENVLEELVGPIQDEFDRETPPITPVGENVFEVDASCPLDVLAETCGLEFPETDAETAGGLVLDLLGRLGKPGDSVTVDGHRLTVLRADPTRIRRIRIEPIETPIAAESAKDAPGQASYGAAESEGRPDCGIVSITDSHAISSRRSVVALPDRSCASIADGRTIAAPDQVVRAMAGERSGVSGDL